jgi:hypothetical protein
LPRELIVRSFGRAVVYNHLDVLVVVFAWDLVISALQVAGPAWASILHAVLLLVDINARILRPRIREISQNLFFTVNEVARILFRCVLPPVGQWFCVSAAYSFLIIGLEDLPRGIVNPISVSNYNNTMIDVSSHSGDDRYSTHAMFGLITDPVGLIGEMTVVPPTDNTGCASPTTGVGVGVTSARSTARPSVGRSQSVIDLERRRSGRLTSGAEQGEGNRKRSKRKLHTEAGCRVNGLR